MFRTDERFAVKGARLGMSTFILNVLDETSSQADKSFIFGVVSAVVSASVAVGLTYAGIQARTSIMAL